jgi:hypothetical protein
MTLLSMGKCNQQSEAVVKPGDALLAEVEGNKLYLSEIDALLPENSSSMDSTRIITAFAESWSREMVVLMNAEKEVSRNIDINKLVKNYRESLVINNFEKDYIERYLDTLITEAQLESFYEENKSNFIASEPVLKFWFSKVPEKASGLDPFYRNWKAGKDELVLKYCKENSTNYVLSQDQWVSLSGVKQLLPESLISRINFSRKTNFQANHANEEYFFSIFDVTKEGEAEPLSFIRNKIIKLILNKRKTTLLEAFREELYKEAVRNNQIKFYDNY